MAWVLGWLRRNDLLAFPLITFTVGWLFYLPAVLFLAGHPERSGWLILFQTPGAAAALLAGVLIRYARGGTAEVREAWRWYLRWKGHRWWWWVSAIALLPMLGVVAGVVNRSFGAGLVDLWDRMGVFALAVLPLIGAAQLASSPLLEEYGWRGFWQSRLQHRLPAWAAALLVGLLWGIHHVPISLAVGADPWRTVAGAVGPSVLAAWLLNSGRSMVGPMLLHAGLNLSMAVIAPDSWWFPLLTLAAATVVLVLSGPRELGGHPRVSLAPAISDDSTATLPA